MRAFYSATFALCETVKNIAEEYNFQHPLETYDANFKHFYEIGFDMILILTSFSHPHYLYECSLDI